MTTLSESLFQAAADREMDAAVRLVRAHLGAGGAAESVLDALAEVQRRVGDLWVADEWSVADEHAASAIVDAALAVLESELGPSTGTGSGRAIVVACPEGEWHVLPARLLAASLRRTGADVVFLGASMPADHLGRFAGDRRPDVVALSVSTPLAYAATVAAIDAVHEHDLPVVLGGRAMGTSPSRAMALGADAWATGAVGLLEGTRTTGPEVVERLAARGEREAVVFGLELARPDLIDAAMYGLGIRFPPMAAYDRRQLEHTRRDLDSIARFAEASILVDDSRVFLDFLDWLVVLLAARGVPARALALSLEVLHEVCEDERLDALLDRALRSSPR